MTNAASPHLFSIADRERCLLARYAMHSADSRGRKHAELEHTYRGPFQRDHDRIVHSSAFRRLSAKMQVFTGDMGDYHRTRLTHTHEVASIARTVGRSLRLNEDLIEALALFHDIGHPPFGHAGEDALDECLAAEGGFSHNQFALTLAEDLESRYAEFSGLNLTYEVLEGQATRADKEASYAATGQLPLLEVQVVEAADSMTYDAHDTDDAVKLQLVALDELAACALVRDALERVRAKYADLRDDLLRKAIVHQLIDRQVTDVLETSAAILGTAGDMTAQEIRRSAIRITGTRELREQKHELERFLYDRVYRHEHLITVRSEAQARLKKMFGRYCQQPELLPAHFQLRAGTVGVPRSVGDYLAGMTDRFCDQQYRNIFEILPTTAS
jgi:dGTPase